MEPWHVSPPAVIVTLPVAVESAGKEVPVAVIAWCKSVAAWASRCSVGVVCCCWDLRFREDAKMRIVARKNRDTRIGPPSLRPPSRSGVTGESVAWEQLSRQKE